MRQLLTFALILVFAGSAMAADLGTIATPKDDSHVLQNMVFDGRDGGDDMASAVAITALPFADTGATCSNSNAWDEVCPYTGSLSGDQWYSYTPAADMQVFVDLEGSAYDTKTYILDGDYNVIACNDDFYSDYTSLIEAAPLYAGITYYIVIDGYGSDCGSFNLAVGEFTPPPPCVIECSGPMEGEPTLGPGYEDNYNGGCNSVTPIFQTLEATDEAGNLEFCAKSGWNDATSGTRDTDWFIVTFGEAGTITWEFEAAQESYFFLLAPQDCGSVAVAEQVLVGPCEPGVMVLTGGAGSIAWIWAGPSDYYPPSGFVGTEYDYKMVFSGLAPGTVATESTSFDNIKSMYR